MKSDRKKSNKRDSRMKSKIEKRAINETVEWSQRQKKE